MTQLSRDKVEEGKDDLSPGVVGDLGVAGGVGDPGPGPGVTGTEKGKGEREPKDSWDSGDCPVESAKNIFLGNIFN